MNNMNKKIALILHSNFEEGEAVITIDVLRRANIGVDIFTLNDKLLTTGSHNIEINANFLFKDLKIADYDGLVLPGGPGCDDLLDHNDLHEVIRAFNNQNKLVAAVCGAPQILGAAGVLEKVKLVKHPLSNKFIDLKNVQPNNVYVDNNILTGVSIGTSVVFALKIVEYLLGKDESKKIKQQLVIF
ncbi:DJ-1 family glyoxalase III [Mesoplasma corruscae]|nr:DJ-1 family glyoxalase III [Mesoplasma corruscae]